MNLKEALTHPISALAAFIGFVGQLGFGWFEPAWGLISATAGTWFPLIAVSTGTILPEIGFEDIATPLLLGAAIVFVAVQVDRLLAKAYGYLKNR
jgi:hypothetical protein